MAHLGAPPTGQRTIGPHLLQRQIRHPSLRGNPRHRSGNDGVSFRPIRQPILWNDSSLGKKATPLPKSMSASPLSRTNTSSSSANSRTAAGLSPAVGPMSVSLPPLPRRGKPARNPATKSASPNSLPSSTATCTAIRRTLSTPINSFSSPNSSVVLQKTATKPLAPNSSPKTIFLHFL
jgi:hypothetical protein